MRRQRRRFGFRPIQWARGIVRLELSDCDERQSGGVAAALQISIVAGHHLEGAAKMTHYPQEVGKDGRADLVMYKDVGVSPGFKVEITESPERAAQGGSLSTLCKRSSRGTPFIPAQTASPFQGFHGCCDFSQGLRPGLS